MARKLLVWGGIAFIVFYVLSQPAGAGGAVKAGLNGLESAATQVATFVNSVVHK